MNSYKKGEDTATVVVLLLLILAAVWLWKNNSGVAHEEKNANQANVSAVSVRLDSQNTVMNDQTRVIFAKDSNSTK